MTDMNDIPEMQVGATFDMERAGDVMVFTITNRDGTAAAMKVGLSELPHLIEWLQEEYEDAE